MMSVFLEGNGLMLSKIAERLSKRDNKQTNVKQEASNQTMATGLTENIQTITELLDSPIDLIQKSFKIGSTHHLCAIFCIDGLVDKNIINDQLLKNVLLNSLKLPDSADEIITLLQMEVLSIDGVLEVNTM